MLKKNLEGFDKKRILVVGDLMLDKYIFGDVERISPEAPVPIVTVSRESYVPGGAANAANNISSLGGAAFLGGVVGKDSAGRTLLDLAAAQRIDTQAVIGDARKQTSLKIRVVGQHQQLLRIDYEDTADIDDETEKKLFKNIQKIGNLDALILSDYAKGALTRSLCERLKSWCEKNRIMVAVDPKPEHKAFYKGISFITPNKKEAEEMAGFKIRDKSDLIRAGNQLMGELDCDVLITTGDKGMSLFERGKKAMHIPTVAKEVYDVSGAGDTVIATMSLAMSSGASLKEAAVLANYAAGIKVGKLGIAPVSRPELKHYLDSLK